jgi:tRNA(Ile2) C34 agmatinyltransferase TiaS
MSCSQDYVVIVYCESGEIEIEVHASEKIDGIEKIIAALYDSGYIEVLSECQNGKCECEIELQNGVVLAIKYNSQECIPCSNTKTQLEKFILE